MPAKQGASPTSSLQALATEGRSTESAASQALTARPVFGSEEWAESVTNAALVAAMPPEVESIWIRRGAALWEDDPTAERGWLRRRYNIRLIANLTGGWNFGGLPMSFGNFDEVSVLISRDPFDAFQREHESGYLFEGNSVSQESDDLGSFFVYDELAMPQRISPPRPEIWKRFYVRFVNERCMISTESAESLYWVSTRLSVSSVMMDEKWRMLFPSNEESSDELILRQYLPKYANQLTMLAAGRFQQLVGFSATFTHGPEPQLHFRGRTVMPDDSMAAFREVIAQMTKRIDWESGPDFFDIRGAGACEGQEDWSIFSCMLFGMYIHGL